METTQMGKTSEKIEIVGDPIARTELVNQTHRTRDKLAVILTWAGLIALAATGGLSLFKLNAVPVLGCLAVVGPMWARILPTYFTEKSWTSTESNST